MSEKDFVRSRMGEGDVRRLRGISFRGVRESIDRRESRAGELRRGVDVGGGGVVGINVDNDSLLRSAAGPVGMDFGASKGASFAATACSLAAC